MQAIPDLLPQESDFLSNLAACDIFAAISITGRADGRPQRKRTIIVLLV
jgi:hypothetical protein